MGAASSKNMTAARLQVGGTWPAYPNLIEAVDRLMQANYRTEVKDVTTPSNADLLWINVAGDEEMNADTAATLRKTIERGGFVLIDVLGGNTDWDETFRAQLKGLDNKLNLEELRRTDPVFTGAVAGTRGFDATRVHLRKALHTRFEKTGRADLHAILWDGKLVGVYSTQDLASGVGYNYFPGCRGPMPEDARHIVMNAFLQAYAKKAGETIQ